MVRRSWYSCRDATSHPLPGCPDDGVVADVDVVEKLFAELDRTVDLRMRLMVIPGWRSGTRNIVRPLCFVASQSVRARHRP